jgi:hypothetical protein
MIRRDFLQAEINKLAHALAKILRLKEAGKTQEADNLLSKSLLHDFDFNLTETKDLIPEDFKKLLLAKSYPAEKLDLLGRYLLQSVSPFQKNPETILVLNHVLTIYKLLEQVHYTQSFENLNRQHTILQFLEQNKLYG